MIEKNHYFAVRRLSLRSKLENSKLVLFCCDPNRKLRGRFKNNTAADFESSSNFSTTTLSFYLQMTFHIRKYTAWALDNGAGFTKQSWAPRAATRSQYHKLSHTDWDLGGGEKGRGRLLAFLKIHGCWVGPKTKTMACTSIQFTIIVYQKAGIQTHCMPHLLHHQTLQVAAPDATKTWEK